MVVLPLYRVYRCHNCNWRGWLPRSTASTLSRNLLVGGYAFLIVLVILGIVLFAIKYWPSAQYNY